ncbi:outer membrane receptor protein involved in Fe transport [Arcicella aurantiaca]|uniref:Outer membrane receptor protein involved in Fe transport n=1 Tax=Arcicella aurantiaca TaxID=591202 RepID=A0A316DHE8_9BACT|nr:TonB-dependent receptor [Arcicella aurantiaca]PWK17601.1 outer membrane receptor protein involved in Fe transport [Arcicella aurantiaca]
MKTLTLLTLQLLLLFFGVTAQNSQTIRGRIEDDVTHTAIIGANIIIEGTNKGSSSDIDGNFKITDVPIGRHNIKISSVGFLPRQLNQLVVTAGKEVILNISLIEQVRELNEVNVKFDRQKEKSTTRNEMALISARSFNIDDTKKYAGALGDPSRMVANFAGVVGANDSRNDIVVRGNSPLGSLWMLEGLNIANPNHFGALVSTGGPVSMLNNNLLDKSDFLTGAFPAEYGNATSSVFDLRLRNGNDEKREFLAQMGFNGFEFGLEGPLSKKVSYLVNYRYSTLGVFKQLGLNIGTGSSTPIFQDLNFKINAILSKKSTLTFFGVGGSSSIDLLGNDIDTTKQDLYGNENVNTRVKYQTLIGGLSYHYKISTKVFTKLTFGISKTYQTYQGDSISMDTRQAFPNGESLFETQKYSLNWRTDYKINAQNTLALGLTSDFINFNLFNKRIYHGNQDKVYVNTNDNTNLIQGFTQFKHRFTNAFSVVGGLHFQKLLLNNKNAIEPRLAINYQFLPNHALSLGYGLHSQMQNIYAYFVQTPTSSGVKYTNKDLDFTKSHHIVLGYEYNISEHLRLKIETYYQKIMNVPVEMRASSYSALNSGASFAPTDNDSLVNNGVGRNYGLEFTLERFFDKNYYFLFTTSLYDAKYKGSDGIERNTAFNTHYVVNALAGKEFLLGRKKTNALNLNIKFTTSGGKYLTPLDLNTSKIKHEAVFDETKAFSEQQGGYFRIDLKASYRKEYHKSSLEFSLDLQNLTNHKNIFQQSFNRRTNSITNEYQQFFFPVPMIRYTF